MEYLRQRQAAKDTDPFLVHFGFSHPHDTRDGTPARLALYAGTEPPPDRELPEATEPQEREGMTIRTAPLAEAEPSLRPVAELRWERDGLHLRLTGQGPWELDALLALARSI